MTVQLTNTPVPLFRVKPGQVLGKGVRNRKTGEISVAFEAGEGVTAEQLAFVRERLAAPRKDIRHMFTPGLAAELSIVDELRERQYDLSTFKFSLFLKGPMFENKKRLVSPRQRPGVLSLRWARLPDDSTPDLICTWHRPCTRRDSNMLLGFCSTTHYSDLELARRITYHRTFTEEVSIHGFDPRSLKLEVKHTLRESAQYANG